MGGFALQGYKASSQSLYSLENIDAAVAESLSYPARMGEVPGLKPAWECLGKLQPIDLGRINGNRAWQNQVEIIIDIQYVSYICRLAF